MVKRYVHGISSDDPLVSYDGSGTTSPTYLLADVRGSIMAETNASGLVTTKHQYGPYGEPMNQSASRFRYTGQILLPGTELYHYKARLYHPKLGRFLQTDPIGYKDGMNWYAYVGNDPINAVDPDGTFVNFIIGAAIGASIDAGLQVMAGMESRKSFLDSVEGGDLKSVAVSAAVGAVGMQSAFGLTAAAKGSVEFGVGAMKTTLQLGSKTERAVVAADSAAKISAVAVVNCERNGSTATTVPAKLIDAAAGKPYGTMAEKAITKAMEEPNKEPK